MSHATDRATGPIGLVAATAAGRAAGDRLAAAWPDHTRRYDGPVGPALRTAFAECRAVVAFLATGATVRVLAPLLGEKTTDPAVVCVDEAGRHAVALLGGHAGGANALAARVAEVLGARAVVTTATDAAGVPGLDTLGMPAGGDLAAVTRAVLDGLPVLLEQDTVDGRFLPLPPLPENVRPGYAFPAGATPAAVLRVTDRTTGAGHPDPAAPRTPDAPEAPDAPPGGGDRPGPALAVPPEAPVAVLRPASLVLGLGASRGVAAEEVLHLVATTLREAGLSPDSVDRLATVDLKADEEGLLAAAEQLGLPLDLHPVEALAAVTVPNPSEVVRGAVGTPSVSEAAALASAGDGAELAVPKRKSAMCTVAVARRRPRGRLALVGLGPGARDLLTPRARAELRRASHLVGLDQYVEQIRDLLRPGTRVLASGLGAEEERARTAVRLAERGHAVALIGSGDAGVYAMASPALQQAGDDIDVVGVPGITAAAAAAAILGAPLGHDHASISLSDLHTPWEVIERRVRAAAEGDFVVTFYNPRSAGRDWQLPAALAILGEHRDPATPVGVVHGATRADERTTVTTLGELDVTIVDMTTVVVVGNTATRVVAGRVVTPRGYRWQE
ncbi:precorrin-3B C(17)-methyltransferase [Allostreptomyces psammosilenae]|uniref:Cobalt-precorrin 5A hydrolase/precorrin-3B C17-methyltransferase n=1 Tax=Allostreptomyces psammosilenae TaxID=1892865 RepID=A0A852ZP49_9ACTN|nr:precorrin-3B C(17)-methyltransferase [Allostreptomyces psammosilenae]NYI04149.1 cobalt-precorrin 5A hydrolase/precorrin-3B C17-methyltransferase [Allostreptomyces psammosilenae]